MTPATPAAYQLLHQGSIALSRVEANGIRIDLDYLNQTQASTAQEIKTLANKLRESKVGKLWRKKFGAKFNLAADDQLSTIFHKELGHSVVSYTDTGKPATGEEAMSHIKSKFLTAYFRWKRLNKVSGTFLKGIANHTTPDGYLRPSFNLNIARTYRSTSSDPNFQNLPIRDPIAGQMVRRCFIPRDPTRCLVEIDYSAIEVRIAACYHKDPTMISYIKDKTKDMHRDMAAECFMVKPEEVSKQARYAAKNMYVFPQFYGDYFGHCAAALWQYAKDVPLMVGDVLMLDHLKSVGIKELGELDPNKDQKKGTFAYHIKKVEDDFWNRRFKVYSRWKKTWMDSYMSRAGFVTLTGFSYHGPMTRKEVINYPVQGSAFHCLLWSLINLQKELRRLKMKTLIVGQIHDSIVADVPWNEVDDYLRLAREVMTERLCNVWKWINVPLEVEADVAPLGKSWAEKTPYEIK